MKSHCAENDTSRVFELAFDLEVELGTSPTRALFEVIMGAKPPMINFDTDARCSCRNLSLVPPAVRATADLGGLARSSQFPAFAPVSPAR